jgi:hypothetical protein
VVQTGKAIPAESLSTSTAHHDLMELAGWTTTVSSSQQVSTAICRFRPFAHRRRSRAAPFCVVFTDWLSMMAALG